MIKRIDHIAIVLPQLEAGMGFWVEALGLPLQRVTTVPDQEVNVAFLPVGDSHIELIAPTTEESGVARYLGSRGPGMHHICLEVDDIKATLAHLQALNVPLIDSEARQADDGKLLAFIHPRGTGGVLVELYQLPDAG